MTVLQSGLVMRSLGSRMETKVNGVLWAATRLNCNESIFVYFRLSKKKSYCVTQNDDPKYTGFILFDFVLASRLGMRKMFTEISLDRDDKTTKLTVWVATGSKDTLPPPCLSVRSEVLTRKGSCRDQPPCRPAPTARFSYHGRRVLATSETWWSVL